LADILDRMGAKAGIGLMIVGLFVSLLVLFARRRPAASAPAHADATFRVQTTNRGRTVGIEEIRQRLEDTKAYDKGSIDTFLESLKAQYGDEAPAVEVVKRLRKLQSSTGGTASAFASESAPGASAAGSEAGKTPDGIRVESTPGGFLLRASCGSFVGGLVWVVFVGVLTAIPFRLWGDLIRGVWTDEGVSWSIAAFLSIWAGVVLYVAAMGAFAFFGEIRIGKEGDRGEIFSGIGRVGRTHRLRWSEFSSVGERDVAAYSSGRSTRTTHYVGLSGTSNEYKFGSELSGEERAFVIAFLREHVFGNSP
jgi:hypothetical protein